MKTIFRLLCLSLSAITLPAQTSTRVAPDCTQDFTFTATAAGTALNNIPQLAAGTSIGGCVYWKVEVEGFNSGAGSLTFQGAPSDATGAAPGSFATFTPLSGTTAQGTNPAVSFPNVYIVEGSYPWVRVNATVSAGTLRGSIHGWRLPPSGGTGGGGGGTTISNFSACANGSNTLSRQAFTFTASGNTQIVAASGSTTIRVCGFLAYTDAASFLKLTQGTGTNCGTGTADVTSSPAGTNYSLLGLTIDFQTNLNASQALCINSAAAVNGGGVVVYVQN